MKHTPVDPSPLAGVRAIIYDLDGTLYDETRHFDYYADRLAERLPADRRAAFRADCAAAAGGRHALRIGSVYDVRRDRILTCRDGRVITVQDWEGRVLPPAAWAADYAEPLAPDQRTLINVGDLWWMLPAVAIHHGLDGAGIQEAFLATRAWMAGPDFSLRPVPGLREAIAALRERGVVQALATNSPQPDSEAVLSKLGLLPLMEPRFYMAGKPAGLPRIVGEVCGQYGLTPGEVAVIGDNYLNEVAPAAALGCRTVYIDAHWVGDGLTCDLRVRSPGELVPYLRRLAEPSPT